MEENFGGRSLRADGCGSHAGCGGSDGGKSDAKMKVGVVQIVQHPALDESNKGFVDALNEQG